MNCTTAGLILVAASTVAMGQTDIEIDRAYAAELRADADQHTSLIGTEAAGLNVEIFTQFRYTYNKRESLISNAPVTVPLGDNDETVGYSTPRTQFRINGAVDGTDLTTDLSFDFGGAFDHGLSGGATGDGGATLRDAFADWKLDEHWSFRFGQFKDPVSFESNVVPEHSQGVERSLSNWYLDSGYTQGIAFTYQDDEWKFVGSLNDGSTNYLIGDNAANSYYNSIGEDDYGVSARLDWLLKGDWDQFADFTSWRGSNDAFRIGAGLNWSVAGTTNATVVNSVWVPPGFAPPVATKSTLTRWTVDAQYEGDGWGIFAAYTDSTINEDLLVIRPSNEQHDRSFVLQGNAFLSDQLESFGRYDIIMFDDDAVLSTLIELTVAGRGYDTEYQTLTIGFNYYLVPESHAARISVDASVVLNSALDLYGLFAFAAAPGADNSSTTGHIGGFPFLGAGFSSKNQAMLRGQFSLLF